MGTTPTNIFDQLRRDEGVRLKLYTDTVGKLTIGVGRNLSDVGISYEEATTLLQNDVVKAQEELVANLPLYTALDPIRQAALVNMVFNLGIHGFLTFTTAIGYMQAGNWDAAATELLNSKWARQVGERATRLAEQIRTGTWV